VPGDGALRSRLGRDVGWNLAPLVLLAVVGLGLNVAIGRWWGAPALGVFQQVTAAYVLFSLAGAAGINDSLMRALAALPAGAPKGPVVVGALVPALPLAALATLLFAAARDPLAGLLDSSGVATGILWATPGLFFFCLNKLLLGAVNGEGRMRAYAVFTSLRYLAIAGALLGARAYGIAGEELGVIWSASEALLLVALGADAARRVVWRACAGWRAWSRAHALYGARSAVAGVLLELNPKVDVRRLGMALPDAAVGVYALAASLAEGVFQLVVVLQRNLNPLIARRLAEGRVAELAAAARAARRWMVPALVAVAGVAALVYPFVVPVLVGDAAFARSTPSFVILMAGLALASAYLPFGQVLLMADRPGRHSLLMAAVVVLNIAANALFIPLLGIEGAATGTALALVASAGLIALCARRLLGLRL
jgi:O-antigen/teichoic acid export membrane protein